MCIYYLMHIYFWDSGQLGLGHKDDITEPTLLHFNEFKEKDNTVIRVACGDRHTVFVTCKGLVYACGANFNGQLGLGHNSDRDTPTLLKYMQHLRVKKVACGSRHTILMLRKSKPNIWMWLCWVFSHPFQLLSFRRWNVVQRRAWFDGSTRHWI